jgi:4'-phosphopantetheinyl transferase EntD
MSIAAILPLSVATCEYPGSTPDLALHPDEQIEAARMSATISADYRLGRACAHNAIRQLGRAKSAIRRGPSREPLWPEGLIGSITHCEGYCAAAVARKTEIAALGIDAERLPGFPVEIKGEILTSKEIESLDILNRPEGLHIAAAFSAKESIYKALYPRVRKFFDFKSVEISIDEDMKNFSIANTSISKIIPYVPRLSGHIIIHDDKILTAAIVCR